MPSLKPVDIAIIAVWERSPVILNVHSLDVIVTCGIVPGTASEIQLALKGNKKESYFGKR